MCILNQTGRQYLAVSVAAGLRCEVSVKFDCENGSIFSNVTLLESGHVTLSNMFDAESDSTVMSLSNITEEDCIHFNDDEQGVLIGPAFVVVYVLAGLPLARLADMYTRLRSPLLVASLAFWSIQVLLTGFATTFWQVLLFRILLGIGQGSSDSVSYSLLADHFPTQHRAFALSVYHYGVYVGEALSWWSATINLALSWRWTFRILGIAGLLMTPLAMLALWEPRRVRAKRRERMRGKKVYSIKEVALFLVKNPPFWVLLVAGSIRAIPAYAILAWLPTFFVRKYGVDADDYSIPVGFVVLFGGILGSFLGGYISDRLSSYWKNAKAYVIAISHLLAAPCIVGVLIAPTAHVSYGLLLLAYITAETWLGPAAAIVQDICMPAMRAQASAIYLGAIFISASIGPVIIPGILNVSAFDSCGSGIGYALLVTVPTFYILSAVLFAILGVVIIGWDRWTKTHPSRYEVLQGDTDGGKDSTS